MVREIERMTPFVLLLILSTKPQAEKHVILKKKFPKRGKNSRNTSAPRFFSL